MKCWKTFLVMAFGFSIVCMPGAAFGADEANVFSKSEKLTLQGDLRLRNEYKDVSNPVSIPDTANNRQRLRFRLSGEATVNDVTKVGFGLASGSSEGATSTNQTLEGDFSSKQVWIDYAYATVDPKKWLHLIGGKFKSIFQHTDMLWDSDIRFDGLGAKLKTRIFETTKIYASGGYFPIDDNTNSQTRDIFLLVGQGGFEFECPEGKGKLQVGLGYYSFENVKGLDTGSDKGNTLVGGVLANDYKIFMPTLKMTCKDVFGLIDVPWGLLGELAQNSGPSKANSAWRAGLWLGKAKVKKPGEWKILGQMSWVEKDAFIDTFPDADFGGNNRKGFEAIVYVCVAKGVIFSADYYDTKIISGTAADQDDEKLLQIDFKFKF